MNKKGFTLVEILGVMVLIATLTLLVLPNVISHFSNKKDDIKKTNDQLVIGAAKLYVSDNKEELNDYSTYCIGVDKLIEKKYISEKKDVFGDDDYAKDYKVKVKIGKPYEYEVVESGQCKNVKPYDIGNKIKVAGIEFYIISIHDDYVVALKAEPLTVDEVNTYGGVGTENNHVNMYSVSDTSASDYHQSYDYGDTNHSGGMAYYSSSTCRWNGSSWIDDGCTTDYNNSDVKYVIDAWEEAKFNNELKTVDSYSARLAQKEELRTQFYPSCSSTAIGCVVESTTPTWVKIFNYYYWTMSQWNSSSAHVLAVSNYNGGDLSGHIVAGTLGAVRPVINVKKSAIQDIITE